MAGKKRSSGVRLAPGETEAAPPLAIAACAGEQEQVRRLIRDGADVNAWWKKKYNGRTIGRCDVLSETVSADQPACAQLLIEAGASMPPDVKSNRAHPAIDAAWRRFGQLGDAAHPELLSDLGRALLASRPEQDTGPATIGAWRALVLAMLDRGGIPHGGVLCDAVVWSDRPLFIRLLDAGLEVTSVVRDAIANGRDDLLDVLASRGHSFDATPVSEHLRTMGRGHGQPDVFPVMRAIGVGRASTVAAILAGKPDLSAATTTGVNALLYATMHDRADLVSMVLAAGADPDVSGTFHHLYLRLPRKPGDPLHVDAIQEWARIEGTTPLIVAVRRGQSPVVTALIEGKADVNLCDAEGLSPLAWAIKLEHPALAAKLRVAGAEDRGLGGTPAHALIAAAGNGDLAEVRRLLAQGAPVESCEEQELCEVTPLSAAACGNHQVIVKELLAAGVNPDRRLKQRDMWECNALLRASMEGRTAACIELIAGGADRVASWRGGMAGGDGETALHSAAERGHLDTVLALVNAGIPVDATCRKGKTALFLAAEHRHVQVVDGLLRLGSDPNHKCKAGSPLESALYAWPNSNEADEKSREDCRTCVRMLLAAGAKAKLRPRKYLLPPLSVAASNDLELTRMMLDAGADPNVGSSLGFPLLHACQDGRMDTARLLIERGADVRARTEEGWTPVLWAAAHGLEFVRLLLDHGADPRAATNAGFNLVWAACRSAQLGAARPFVDHLTSQADKAGATVVTTAIGQRESAALATLRFVLAAGADPNSRMESGTPLDEQDLPESLRAALIEAAGR